MGHRDQKIPCYGNIKGEGIQRRGRKKSFSEEVMCKLRWELDRRESGGEKEGQHSGRGNSKGEVV